MMAVDRQQFEWYSLAPRRLGFRHLFYPFVGVPFDNISPIKRARRGGCQNNSSPFQDSFPHKNLE
jgi:hypothetical protein